MSQITDKEWLDLAWKYFQQHAQQRISYFNFFVIFSTILTTGLVTTYQETFGLPYFGVAIGLIQVFLSVMFWKIDQRNRFLTKHAEEVIMSYEAKNKANIDALLFSDENTKTIEREKSEKKKFLFLRQITHGKSYKIIYSFFFLWGIVGTLISATVSIASDDEKTNGKTKIEASVYLKYDRIDSLKREIYRKDSITNLLVDNLKKLSTEIDSLEIIYSSYRQNHPSDK